MSFVLALMLISPIAGAQQWAASAEPDGLPGGHAWFLAPWISKSGEPTDILVHAPPRLGMYGAEPGAARPAREVQSVDAIAAVGRRVYLIGTAKEQTGRAFRPTLYMDADPVGLRGSWRNNPNETFRAGPPLEFDSELLGVGGAHGSLLVMRQAEGGPELWRLKENAWQLASLPEGFGEAGGRTMLRADGAIALLWASSNDGAVSWRSSVVDGELAWQRMPALMTPDFSLTPSAEPSAEIFLATAGEWVTARPIDGRLGVTAWTAAGPIAFATVDASSILSVMPGASPRLIAVKAKPNEDPKARPVYEANEISLSTGAVWFGGDVRSPLPVNANEFRLLALTLLAITAATLVLALRAPEEAGAFALPRDTALAESGRRLAATVIDLGPVLIISSKIFDTSVFELLSIFSLFTPDQSWAAIPGALTLGWLIATVTEGFTGRSLGKLLLGCRVTMPSPEAGAPINPGLARAAVRNAVKYFLPPVAMLALLEPAARHRGDGLAGVAVVIEFEPEETGADEDR